MFFTFLLTVSLAFHLVDLRKYHQEFSFCNGEGQQLLIADFNGDKKADLFCYQKSNGQKTFVYARDSLGYDSAATSEFSKEWCSHNTGEIHLGDFNGDERQDLLCHYTSSGYKSIALADASGNFTGTSWEKAVGFCSLSTAQLYAADFNGDGRTDLLCHEITGGTIWISYANERGEFPYAFSWGKYMGFCKSSSNQLLLGDLNGDSKADMMCASKTTGNKQIALANSDGTFSGISWEKDLRWCKPSENLNKKIYFGDFNNDSRTDMTCYDSLPTQINYAKPDGSFEEVYDSWESWCVPNVFFGVGDFDGNGVDDWICKDASNLWIWTTEYWTTYAPEGR